VRDAVLRFAGVLRFQRCQVLIDLGVRDLDLAVDFTLTKALDDHLVADVVAIFGIRNVFLRQQLAEFLGRELVLRRDALNCPLDLAVVDLYAVLLGLLQQRALGNQSFQHLLVEHVGGGRLDLLLLQLLLHDSPRVVELVLRHRLVVDDRDHAIDGYDRGWGIRGLRADACGEQHQRGREDEANVHGKFFRTPGNSR
jgi:hypothetical protein